MAPQTPPSGAAEASRRRVRWFGIAAAPWPYPVSNPIPLAGPNNVHPPGRGTGSLDSSCHHWFVVVLLIRFALFGFGFGFGFLGVSRSAFACFVPFLLQFSYQDGLFSGFPVEILDLQEHIISVQLKILTLHIVGSLNLKFFRREDINNYIISNKIIKRLYPTSTRIYNSSPIENISNNIVL